MDYSKLSLEALRAQRPDLVRQLEDDAAAQADAGLQGKVDAAVKTAVEQGGAVAAKTGREEGVAAERARIAEIDRLTLPGGEKLAAECKADGSSPEAFALKQTELQREARSGELAKMQRQGAKLDEVLPEPAASGTGEAASLVGGAVDPKAVDEATKAAAANPDHPQFAEALGQRWAAEPGLREDFQSFEEFKAYQKAALTPGRLIGARAA